MPRKIAVKRLTASDLTFFEWHFRNQNAGNQKAVNLNADVFVDQLYPALPELAMELAGKLPIDLSIFGPGTKGLHNLQRKIVKFGSYKNWRLNGEFVYNPVEDPERYNVLRPGDFALMEFSGAALPSAAKLVLVAAGVVEDTSLHTEIKEFLGARKMAMVSVPDLDRFVSAAFLVSTHPALLLNLDSEMEDAALGGSLGPRRLYAHISTRQISKEDLLKARQNAEETGRIGEELVNGYLVQLRQAGLISSIEWTAQMNAVAPYDFKSVKADGMTILIDVKCTAGEFSRLIHLSFNEILQIANGVERYDVFRVYEASSSKARLRICENLRPFALGVFNALSALPTGVTADGISLVPSLLDFSAETIIEVSEDENEGETI